MTSQRILELVMDALQCQSRWGILKRGSKKILDERYASKFLKQVSQVESGRKAVKWKIYNNNFHDFSFDS